MRKKRETKVLDMLKKIYPRAHFQRIEGSFSGGILDLNACQGGIEVWLEMKKYKRPKTSRGLIKPNVQTGQIGWERERRQAGGQTFVGLLVDNELYLLPGWSLIELWDGITQDRLEELRLPSHSLFGK